MDLGLLCHFISICLTLFSQEEMRGGLEKPYNSFLKSQDTDEHVLVLLDFSYLTIFYKEKYIDRGPNP